MKRSSNYLRQFWLTGLSPDSQAWLLRKSESCSGTSKTLQDAEADGRMSEQCAVNITCSFIKGELVCLGIVGRGRAATWRLV